jgi:hypothetical protein
MSAVTASRELQAAVTATHHQRLRLGRRGRGSGGEGGVLSGCAEASNSA